MGAKIRTSNDPVAAPIDRAFLDAMPRMLNLVTDYGDLDIAFDPAGPKRGFSEWGTDATPLDVGNNLIIRDAALADVIDSKTSANRLKDHRALPYLESLQDQLRAKDPRNLGTADHVEP